QRIARAEPRAVGPYGWERRGHERRPGEAPEQSRAAGAEPHRPGPILARSGGRARPLRQDDRNPSTELEAPAESGDQRPAPPIRHQLVRQPRQNGLLVKAVKRTARVAALTRA